MRVSLSSVPPQVCRNLTGLGVSITRLANRDVICRLASGYSLQRKDRKDTESFIQGRILNAYLLHALGQVQPTTIIAIIQNSILQRSAKNYQPNLE